MLTYCVRNVLSRRLSALKASRQTRSRCSSSPHEVSDHVGALLQLCVDRSYISPGDSNVELFRRGVSCSYGPLGAELRKTLLEQWWHSVSRSTAQVFGINTLSSSDTATGGRLKMVESGDLKLILAQQELSKEQVAQKVDQLLEGSPCVRTNFLQGALEQFVPSLELVNRKLPFGLAETGLCFQPSVGSGWPAEVTQTSLVWFCSPRSSSQWLDHWTRQRLKWWRKFALSPSDFSSSDVPEEDLEPAASRGVRIVYSFPWGQETLETLWSRGDAELLETHRGARSRLQRRDGRKSIPHVVSVTGNVDRGLMAFLSNSLQTLKRDDRKQKLQQRQVLKLHPVLAPVKVALDIGRGATTELRQVCEGLLQEFMEANISAWPGYLKTPTSLEQLNSRYDEMGVLFAAVISESTLESGLLQVRSRDTTVKETMHISEIKEFVSRYISAAQNI